MSKQRAVTLWGWARWRRRFVRSFRIYPRLALNAVAEVVPLDLSCGQRHQFFLVYRLCPLDRLEPLTSVPNSLRSHAIRQVCQQVSRKGFCCFAVEGLSYQEEKSKTRIKQHDEHSALNPV